MLVHNALTPYVVKSFQDMTWEELGGKVDDDLLRRQVAATPVGRLAHADDVAQAVAFCAGEDNAFMTGTTAVVNGGMAMY